MNPKECLKCNKTKTHPSDITLADVSDIENVFGCIIGLLVSARYLFSRNLFAALS